MAINSRTRTGTPVTQMPIRNGLPPGRDSIVEPAADRVNSQVCAAPPRWPPRGGDTLTPAQRRVSWAANRTLREAFTSMKHHINVLLVAGLCLAAGGTLGIVGCSSSGTSSAPRGIDKYVKAVQAYQSGDKDRAVQNLVAATRVNPDLIMARLMLGD